ncbi:MAG: HU family DNA-binding protein [Muribaculaceae bacterium]|nr:HU family DNA-binding protein [Muribaculaceae bacterium]
MNSKINAQQLAQLLAVRSGLELKVCEAYLNELFSVVTQVLKRGENVKISGFGTFKLNRVEERRSVDVSTGGASVIPSHVKVTFIPAKEMAALANAPFAMFEAVELTEDLSVAELAALNGSEAKDASEDADGAELAENSDVTEASESSETSELSEDSEVSEKSELSENSESSESSDEGEMSETSDNPESRLPVKYVYPDREVEALGRRKFSYGFMVGFITALIALGAIVGCYWYFYHNVEEEEAEVKAENELVETPPMPADSLALVADTTPVTDSGAVAEDNAPAEVQEQPSQAEQVATAPSDNKPVYDTVTKTRYLTTIAKEHYGSYHFWPYIYEENKSHLGHPDRIRPGTRVVVPPLSKYGVSPARQADVEAAKRLGVQIYARFK